MFLDLNNRFFVKCQSFGVSVKIEFWVMLIMSINKSLVLHKDI